MHIALCDDDKESLEDIQYLVDEYNEISRFNVTYKAFSDPQYLVDYLKKERFDLYILDVVMPEKTGLDLAKDIRSINQSVPIIFLTTAPEFAVASYRVQAQDYLLKPVFKNEIFSVLDREFKRIELKQSKLVVNTMQRMEQIPISNIIYMEFSSRQLYIVLTEGGTIKVKGSMYEMEIALEKYTNFIRPHRSYIVNLQYVKYIDKDTLCTIDDKLIPIARNNIVEMKNRYMNSLLLNEAMKSGDEYE